MNAICRDCKRECSIYQGSLGRATRPRCQYCGGLIDMVRGRIPYARTPKGKVVITSPGKCGKPPSAKPLRAIVYHCPRCGKPKKKGGYLCHDCWLAR